MQDKEEEKGKNTRTENAIKRQIEDSFIFSCRKVEGDFWEISAHQKWLCWPLCWERKKSPFARSNRCCQSYQVNTSFFDHVCCVDFCQTMKQVCSYHFMSSAFLSLAFLPSQSSLPFDSFTGSYLWHRPSFADPKLFSFCLGGLSWPLRKIVQKTSFSSFLLVFLPLRCNLWIWRDRLWLLIFVAEDVLQWKAFSFFFKWQKLWSSAEIADQTEEPIVLLCEKKALKIFVN